MSRFKLAAAALLLLAGIASAQQNSSLVDENWCGKENVCGLHDDDGPWMSVLQQWALSAPEHGERQGEHLSNAMVVVNCKTSYLTTFWMSEGCDCGVGR